MDRDHIIERLDHLTEWEQRVLEHVLHRKTMAKNVNEQFDEQLTLGARLADLLAQFGGSWTFLICFAGVLAIWILGNQQATRPFDPYPFILLNLVLSCLAAIQAPVIMMSQNRHAAKDRMDAQHDYEVNLKSEVEVLALHAKLDAIRDQQLAEMRWLLERIEARLAQIAPGDDAVPDAG